MASFLDRLIGRNRTTSADIAKERLKLVLVTDRSNLPQERLEAMQAEILEVIKRYVEIDEPEIELKLVQRDRENYLVADIPLHRQRSLYQAASEQAPPPIPDPAPRPAQALRAKTQEAPAVRTEATSPEASESPGETRAPDESDQPETSTEPDDPEDGR